MFKTPSKRGTSSRPSFTPGTPGRKRGLFEDGQWLCDCKPRLPALHFQVKKETPNKGKWFYTCQKQQNHQCGFFLFEHDAQPRERDALIQHNCRSENGITGKIEPKNPAASGLATPSRPPAWEQLRGGVPRPPPPQRIFTGLPRDRGESQPKEELLSHLSDTDEEMELASLADYPWAGTPSRSQSQSQSSQSQNKISQTLRNPTPHGPGGRGAAAAHTSESGLKFQAQSYPPVTPTAKRKRDVFLSDSDDEFGGGDLDDSDTERQLAAITDESARKQDGQRRQAQTLSAYETPTAQRTVDGVVGRNGLPTPATRNSLLITAEARERTAKRQRRVDFAASLMPGVSDGEDDETQSQSQSVVDINTPTPYRKVDALATHKTITAATPTKAAAGGDEYSRIADEVMSLLNGQPVSESTRRTVHAAMERHEIRVKGVVMGRAAARAALEAKDKRIAELQARLVSLENGRKMDKERLKELSSGLLQLSQED